MSEITITVSGPVGCGKSAIAGEIEIAMKAIGVPVRMADEAADRSEKNMTGADWTGYLEMYKPSVVIAESISRPEAIGEGVGCETCKGHGVIGGIYRVGDGDVDGWEEPCPDCSPAKLAAKRAVMLWRVSSSIECIPSIDVLEGNIEAAIRECTSPPPSEGEKRMREALEWMRDRDDRNGSLPEAYRQKIDAALSDQRGGNGEGRE